VLGVNQEIIRSADQKVYLLIVCSALIVTFLANNIERIIRMGMWHQALLVVFLICSATFFIFALRTLFARGAIAPSAKHKGLIFFGDIYHHGSAQSYLEQVRATDLNDFYDDLAKQAYFVSEIATQKYTNYRRAWMGLMGEVITFLILEASIIFFVK
jgi:hypothetical protein